jgi:hypothetical protein
MQRNTRYEIRFNDGRICPIASLHTELTDEQDTALETGTATLVAIDAEGDERTITIPG